MKINWIEVENFKGFDKRRFEFDEHFTLIVGENGTGKTTAVEAIILSLAGWVGAISSRQFQQGQKIIRKLSRKVGAGFIIETVLPMRLSARLTGLPQPINVAFNLVSDGVNQMTGEVLRLRQYFSKSATELLAPGATSLNILPLCACYQANRHFTSEAKPDFNNILGKKPERMDGYTDWNQAVHATKDLTEWLARWQAITQEDQAEALIFKTTKAAIIGANPSIRDIKFSAKRGQAVVERETGEIVEFADLSDGQKSLLSIVGDIARRAALLNPHLDNPAAETPGVVVIDEIDLHLHPRWQRRIMEDLRRTFPKIQFIATTHSPIIISAAKDAKVIQLLPDGLQEFPQAYGMDLNYIVEVLQGGEARPREVTECIERANELIEEGKLDEAREVVSKIKALQHGDAPDSIELESTIENLIALAHAED